MDKRGGKISRSTLPIMRATLYTEPFDASPVRPLPARLSEVCGAGSRNADESTGKNFMKGFYRRGHCNLVATFSGTDLERELMNTDLQLTACAATASSIINMPPLSESTSNKASSRGLVTITNRYYSSLFIPSTEGSSRKEIDAALPHYPPTPPRQQLMMHPDNRTEHPEHVR